MWILENLYVCCYKVPFVRSTGFLLLRFKMDPFKHDDCYCLNYNTCHMNDFLENYLEVFLLKTLSLVLNTIWGLSGAVVKHKRRLVLMVYFYDLISCFYHFLFFFLVKAYAADISLSKESVDRLTCCSNYI